MIRLRPLLPLLPLAIAGERDGTARPTPGRHVFAWRRTPRGGRMRLDLWTSRPQVAR